MTVDSRQQKLNNGQIVAMWLQDTPGQPHPPAVAMAAILKELSDPRVKTKQIGNTLFEIIPGDDKHGFFKAFNADTGENFVENSKKFVVWAKKSMGMQVLLTEFRGDEIMQLFKVISKNPPMPGMGYQVLHMQSGATQIVLNLGD